MLKDKKTISGREIISRSDDDARSSIMFISFSKMEVNGDLDQTILAECGGKRLSTMELKRELKIIDIEHRIPF